jgi:putative endonuclease
MYFSHAQNTHVQNNSQNYGAAGEALAVNHLLKKGYTILERNWRFRKYEIDIIAQKDDIIVIIEVKTRKNGNFGEPEIFVTRKKQSFLIAAAHHYLVERDISLEVRFDIMAVVGLHATDTIRHLESAFYPTA